MYANTSSQSLPPLANSCANNVLLQSAPDFNQSLLKFVQIIDASFKYTLLHDAPNLVVNQVQVGAVWRPQIRSDEVGGLALQLLSSLTGVVGLRIIRVEEEEEKCINHNKAIYTIG